MSDSVTEADKPHDSCTEIADSSEDSLSTDHTESVCRSTDDAHAIAEVAVSTNDQSHSIGSQSDPQTNSDDSRQSNDTRDCDECDALPDGVPCADCFIYEGVEWGEADE